MGQIASQTYCVTAGDISLRYPTGDSEFMVAYNPDDTMNDTSYIGYYGLKLNSAGRSAGYTKNRLVEENHLEKCFVVLYDTDVVVGRAGTGNLPGTSTRLNVTLETLTASDTFPKTVTIGCVYNPSTRASLFDTGTYDEMKATSGYVEVTQQVSAGYNGKSALGKVTFNLPYETTSLLISNFQYTQLKVLSGDNNTSYRFKQKPGTSGSTGGGSGDSDKCVITVYVSRTQSNVQVSVGVSSGSLTSGQTVSVSITPRSPLTGSTQTATLGAQGGSLSKNFTFSWTGTIVPEQGCISASITSGAEYASLNVVYSNF